MELIEFSKDQTIILRIVGRLDSTTFTKFEEKLTHVMNAGFKDIHIDLKNMDFVSSTGLRVFLIGLKRMNETNGTFTLYNMQPNIREIFEISGFTKIFPIVEKSPLDISSL